MAGEPDRVHYTKIVPRCGETLMSDANTAVMDENKKHIPNKTIAGYRSCAPIAHK